MLQVGYGGKGSIMDVEWSFHLSLAQSFVFWQIVFGLGWVFLMGSIVFMSGLELFCLVVNSGTYHFIIIKVQPSPGIVCGRIFYCSLFLEVLGIFPNHRGFTRPSYSNIDVGNAPLSEHSHSSFEVGS